jgi:hypothetical protein
VAAHRLLIWKVLNVGFSGAPDVQSAAAGERHDIAGAAGQSRFFAEALVGIPGDLLLRFAAKAEGADAPAMGKPEVTGAMQTYLDLHRHAAVRAVMTDHPAIALRLLIAHAIAGSPLWSIKVDDQSARNEAVAESVETSAGEPPSTPDAARSSSFWASGPTTPR